MTGNRQVRFLGECERATFQSYPTRAVEKATSSLTLIVLAAGLAVTVCGADIRPDRHSSKGQLSKTRKGRKQKPK